MAALTASFSGVKLSAARRPAQRRAAARSVAVKAKYGDESTFFDLQDLESTTGSWTVYGVDEPKRYASLQNQFFERAAQGLTRREALYSFLALAGPAGILVWGGKGSKDAKLPITIGPLAKPPLGPRDKL